MLIDEKEKNSFSETEITEIVNYLSYELILENLKNQIEELNGFGNVNYLEIFDDKYNYIIKNYGETQEIIDKVSNLRNEFYCTAMKEIQDKFYFKLTFKDILLKEEFYNIVKVFYDFFVININENLKNYFINYVKQESKNIIKTYKNQINMKDLYFSLLKKKLNKDNTILVFSLPKVPDIIDFSFIEDFIDMVVKNDPDEYNYFIVNKVFNTEEIIDDVVCDIDNFKSLVKRLIKEENMIIYKARAEIYQSLVDRKEE